jgi:hypothetical protein
MTTHAIVPTGLAVPGRADPRGAGRDRFKLAVRRRTGRIRVLLLILALLLPVLITTVLGDR